MAEPQHPDPEQIRGFLDGRDIAGIDVSVVDEQLLLEKTRRTPEPHGRDYTYFRYEFTPYGHHKRCHRITGKDNGIELDFPANPNQAGFGKGVKTIIGLIAGVEATSIREQLYTDSTHVDFGGSHRPSYEERQELVRILEEQITGSIRQQLGIENGFNY